MATSSAVLGILNAAQSVTCDVSPGGAACFNIVPAGTPTLSLVFEASCDNVNFQPIAAHVLNPGNGLMSGPNTFTVVNPTAAQMYVVPAYGFSQIRCRVSAFTSGSVTVTADVGASCPAGMLYADVEGQKPTYSGTLTAFTPAATATDILVFPGSASKVVKLTRLEIYGVATAAAVIDIALIKRTTADTGGTSAAAPTIAHDLNDPAATSLPLSYSANPGALGSTGSGGGTVRAGKLFLGATPAPAGGLGGIVWEFGAGRQGRCPTARGVAQQICVNWGGAAVPAGTVLDVAYEITEE